MASTSPFGTHLRLWRRRRGLSQLQLATLGGTTPRHVSFIETGRSRPGRALVLRLAECMQLPVRDRNEMLSAAGLAPAYPERDLSDAQLQPFRTAVEAILSHHHPYPGCAADGLGQVHVTNPCFDALFPGVAALSPEAAIDQFFAPGPARDVLDNFAEVAWAFVDARRVDAMRTNNPRLTALAERALAHLADVPRPAAADPDPSPVVCPRFRFGDQRIATFSTVMRFEHPNDVTISELRVELIFPVDDVGKAFFEAMAAGRDAPAHR